MRSLSGPYIRLPVNAVSSLSEAVIALVLLVLIPFMHLPPAATAASLTLDMKPSGITYSSVSFAITVHEAPNDVEAFGLEVWFDPNILAFERCEKGGLVKQFIIFNASTPESGVVRIAGIAPEEETGISEGASGELAVLLFRVITPCVATDLRLSTLIDQIKGWDTADGTLEPLPSCAWFDDPIVFGEDSGYGLCFVGTLL